jgi:uncharacterized protein YjbI with pentapeptide repeats
MANAKYVDMLRQGANAWRQWWAEQPETSLDVDLEGADLEGVDLHGIHLSHARLRGANLARANLSKAYLVMADLSDATLCGAGLHSANLELANLSHCDLSRADLRHARLRNATLQEASAVWADFSFGDLWGTNLMRANLEHATFQLAMADDANLSEANLRHTDWLRARLDHASLRQADLSGASLEETDLTETLLEEADLTEVFLRRTLLNSVDLSHVKGLDTLRYEGRSFVDLPTLYAANNQLPLSFLRGIGLPGAAIAYARTAERSALQTSCYVYYAPGDQGFAARLSQDLQARGIRCWLMDAENKARLFTYAANVSRLSDKYLLVLPQEITSGSYWHLSIPHILEWEHQIQKQLLILLCTSRETQEVAPQWWETISRRSWRMVMRQKPSEDVQLPFPNRAVLDFSQWQEEEAYQRALQQVIILLAESGT